MPADLALQAAHLLALTKAAAKYAGDEERLAAITREMASVQKELDGLKAKDAPAAKAASEAPAR